MIDGAWRQDLHNYIGGIVHGLDAKALIIGGVADHVRILMGLRTKHSVADLVRETKKASNAWAGERYAEFGWQSGYAAFAVDSSNVKRVCAYIANQEAHHHKVGSADELRAILIEHGLEIDEVNWE